MPPSTFVAAVVPPVTAAIVPSSLPSPLLASPSSILRHRQPSPPPSRLPSPPPSSPASAPRPCHNTALFPIAPLVILCLGDVEGHQPMTRMYEACCNGKEKLNQKTKRI
ncbi:hypothetical protein RIF29_20054 [Crotalaria pallida]|uniref:Uncharacterized protein n=1 Tax=Crotalaria pallida TaxID=3830 RepID=A0AAN9I604_CROPI